MTNLTILKKELRQQCKELGIDGILKRHPSERTIIVETDAGTILFYPDSFDEDCEWYRMRPEKIFSKDKIISYLFGFYSLGWKIKQFCAYYNWKEFEREIRIKYIKLKDW